MNPDRLINKHVYLQSCLIICSMKVESAAKRAHVHFCMKDCQCVLLTQRVAESGAEHRVRRSGCRWRAEPMAGRTETLVYLRRLAENFYRRAKQAANGKMRIRCLSGAAEPRRKLNCYQ